MPSGFKVRRIGKRGQKADNEQTALIHEGPLDLVFIFYWASNVDVMWEEPSLGRFLRRLATFSRLLCFDKRGSGVSDPVPLATVPTLEQWTDDVRTVMDAAGSKRAALLGHADGGQMAMLFAATYPERTSALVLVDTCARHLRDVDYPCGLPADRVPRYLQRTEELWGTGRLLDILAPSVAHDERFQRWYGRYERLTMGPRAMTATQAAYLERDLRGVLPSIRVPTLVLHRAGDRFIRAGHGRLPRRAHPRGEVRGAARRYPPRHPSSARTRPCGARDQGRAGFRGVLHSLAAGRYLDSAVGAVCRAAASLAGRARPTARTSGEGP